MRCKQTSKYLTTIRQILMCGTIDTIHAFALAVIQLKIIKIYSYSQYATLSKIKCSDIYHPRDDVGIL